jgi:hypothetical protein
VKPPGIAVLINQLKSVTPTPPAQFYYPHMHFCATHREYASKFPVRCVRARSWQQRILVNVKNRPKLIKRRETSLKNTLLWLLKYYENQDTHRPARESRCILIRRNYRPGQSAAEIKRQREAGRSLGRSPRTHLN